MLTRRTALAAGTATLLAGAARPRPLFGRHRPIGINLYAVSEAARRDLEGTLRTLAAIGYREVEASLDAYSAERMGKAVAAAGLRCSDLNVLSRPLRGGLSMAADPGLLADGARALGAGYVTCTLFPLPPGVEMRPRPGEDVPAMLARVTAGIGPDHWRRTADWLNEKGEALRRHGVRFAYHNHNAELAPHGDANGLTIMLERSDPALVDFHMDAGWVVAAGQDPAELIRAYPGRFRLMHVKDVAPGQRVNTAMSIATTPVGQGIVDWRRVLGTAVAGGVRHFAVEQEPPFPRPQLEDARTSYDWLIRLAA